MSALHQDVLNPPLQAPANLDSLSRQQLHKLLGDYLMIIKAQQAIYQIASIPRPELTQTAFFTAIHEIISSLIFADNIIIAAKVSSENTYQYVYAKNRVDPELFDKLQTVDTSDLQKSLCGFVINNRQALLADTAQLADLNDGSLIYSQEIHCQQWLAVPLFFNEQVTGVLALQSLEKADQYSERDRDMLMFVCDHIGSSVQRQAELDLQSSAKAELEHAIYQQEEHVQQRTDSLIKANFELHRQLRENEKSQARLFQDALHDTLTRLPNKTLFIDRLAQTIVRSKRQQNSGYTVMLINLENFRQVNDNHGFLAGDRVIKETANRLQKIIRPGDCVARFSGDEFCMLLEKALTKNQVEDFVDRIITQLSKPMNVKGFDIATFANIGVALGQRHYENPAQVLSDVETALFQAKKRYDLNFAVFDQNAQSQAIERYALETDLRVALKAKEIHLHFQPVIDLQNQTIASLEALLRWQHHAQGYIEPLQIIKFAEQGDLTPQLNRQILNQAFSPYYQWCKTNPLFKQIPLSINLSPAQFQLANFVGEFLHLLSDYQLASANVQIEIVEETLIDHFDITRKTLRLLSEAGVKIVLDNFGRGISSLSYLPHFTIDVIKIDPMLVHNMLTDPIAKKMLHAVQHVAKGLNVSLVAKGIETPQQLAYLQAAGIDYGQGFLFSAPLTAEAIANQVKLHGLSWQI